MTETDKNEIKAEMERARARKHDYDRAHPHPGDQGTHASGTTRNETDGKDPKRARDALDAPMRKRSHTPRTGDG